MRTRSSVPCLTFWLCLLASAACLAQTIRVEPESGHDFGKVDVNGSRATVFTVRNVYSLIEGTATIEGSDGAFMLLDEQDRVVNEISYSLLAGEDQSITVQFVPNDEGSYTGSINFTGGGGASRSLAGRATEPPDFTSVSDIFDGNWTALRLDDLVLAARQQVWTFPMNQERVDGEPVVVSTAEMFGELCYSHPRSKAGRVFSLRNDVIATFCPEESAKNNVLLNIANRFDPTQDILVEFPGGSSFFQMAIADFNRDGYDDILAVTSPPGPEGLSQARIIRAKDQLSYDIEAGVELGKPTDLPIAIWHWTPPAVGDFNADGVEDFALNVGVTAYENNIIFASVCSGYDRNNYLCKDKEPFEIVWWPQTIATEVATASIVAGNFLPGVVDELIVADRSALRAYRFIGSDFQLIDEIDGSFIGWLAKGRLAWFGTSPGVITEQAVYADARDDRLRVIVINFEGAEEMVDYRWSEAAADRSHQVGVAVGRFTQDVVTESGAAFNPQIAVWSKAPSGASQLRVLKTTDPPSDFTPKEVSVSDYSVPDPSGVFLQTLHNLLDAGSGLGGSPERARNLSFRLGPPLVVRAANSLQPSLVIAKPPMFADYVDPDFPSNPGPQLMNFSVTVNDFFTKYKFASSQQTSATDQQTTSFTWGGAESTKTGVAVGIPKEIPVIGGSGAWVEYEQAWGQTDSDFTEAKYNTYTAESFSFTAQTLGADIIKYVDRRMNYYVYPVLGTKTCVLDDMTDTAEDECTEEDAVPLVAIVSGPDEANQTSLTVGTALEWYQPTWEPFHVLSYPWNEEQLRMIEPHLDILGSSSRVSTTAAVISFDFNWATGVGNTQTGGASRQQEFTTSLSVGVGNPKYNEPVPGNPISGVFVGTGSYGQSCAFAQVNTAVTTLSSSEGIDLSWPGVFKGQQFGYELQGFIFGKNLSVSLASSDGPTLQGHTPQAAGTDCPSRQPDQTKDVPANQTTEGVLRMAFTADVRSNGGGWWQVGPYSRQFDLALNKPSRLEWVTRSLASGQEVPTNCLPINASSTDSLTCVKIWGPESASYLWTSAYYYQRGLLITVGGFTGPQRNTSFEGGSVGLTAVVYNYSLVDMPKDSVVKARFYRQPVNPANLDAMGDSVLIEEVDLGPIPAFDSQDTDYIGRPNRIEARTTWDTTGHVNESQIFWVVVWAEDLSGEMLGELYGHGLEEKPGQLSAINCNFADDPLDCKESKREPQLERIDADACWMANNSTPCREKTVNTSVSNNVGFYKGVFTVLPVEEEKDALTAANTEGVVLENLSLSPKRVHVGESVAVTADVRAVGADASGIFVEFMDEEKGDDTILVDVEAVSPVRVDQTSRLHVLYRPRDCGERQIKLATREADKVATASAMLDVICELDLAQPAPGKTTGLQNSGAGNTFRLFLEFETEEELDLRTARLTISSLLRDQEKELAQNEAGDAIVPLTPRRAKGARSDQANYKGEVGKTKLQARLTKSGEKQLKAEFRINGAAITAPECGSDSPATTALMTKFTVDDQVHAPVDVAVLGEWECNSNETGRVKTLVSRQR